MGQTLFDKIWDAHFVARRADGRELLYIDRHVLHELHAPHAFDKLERAHRPVRRPDLTFSMQDHTVSTRPDRDDTTNPDGTAFLRAMREGSRRHGIRIFDLGDPEQGISHVVAPELGMVLPGATHVVPDNPACTVGALGRLPSAAAPADMHRAPAPRSTAWSGRSAWAIGVTATFAATSPPRTVRCASLPMGGSRGRAAMWSNMPARWRAPWRSRVG